MEVTVSSNIAQNIGWTVSLMEPTLHHQLQLQIQLGNQCRTKNILPGLKEIKCLLSWINATLSDSALPYIVGMNTSKDAWDSLERRYSSLSHSQIFELKKRQQHIKKGTSTIQEYLHQIKVISDQ